MKYLQFTIAETSGRTFELPLTEAKKLIKQIKKDNKYMSDFEVEDEHDMACFFESYGLDEISQYEKDNSYCETEVACAEISEVEL